MNKKIIKLKNKKIAIIFIIILFITFFITGTVFAKYVSKITGKGMAYIAKPIVELVGNNTLNLDISKENSKYYFEVKNYNEQNEITEVKMEYYIEIQIDNPENIKYEIYKINENKSEKIEMKNEKSRKFTLRVKEKQIDKYCIEINNKETKECQMQIKILSKQIE